DRKRSAFDELARATRLNRPRDGLSGVTISMVLSKPAARSSLSITLASRRLKSYSSTPRALSAPGAWVPCPTSTMVRKLAARVQAVACCGAAPVASASPARAPGAARTTSAAARVPARQHPVAQRMARAFTRAANWPTASPDRAGERVSWIYRMLERTTPSSSAPSSAGALAPVISVTDLSKTYASGFQALRQVNLDIRDGEIFALLGPNGAGKTTLIGVICGIMTASSGRVRVAGHDIVTDYRAARALIGLVPQELHTDSFETVWKTVSFSRGLWGMRADPAHIEKVLRDLSLWDRKDSKIMTLSGGMMRRVMMAR